MGYQPSGLLFSGIDLEKELCFDFPSGILVWVLKNIEIWFTIKKGKKAFTLWGNRNFGRQFRSFDLERAPFRI